MKSPWLLAVLLALLAPVPSSPGAGDPRERYTYTMAARDRPAATVEVGIRGEGGGLSYESTTLSPRGSERIVLRTGLDGDLIEASRTVGDAVGAPRSRQTVRREGQTVVVGRDDGAGDLARPVPPGAIPAVDASLLLRLRSFPFGTAAVWDLLVVDFSQVSVGATVRQAGLEWIRVPAGEFECYRMEVVVDLPILKPTVTFWISVAEPHFLVRHEGKKGPFTPSYETSLVSIGAR